MISILPWFLVLVLVARSNVCQSELSQLKENEVCKCT